jgi:pilus assembly protein Flp/PilA
MAGLVGACWRFLRSEEGPTAVEYAVMLMCIIVVCIVAIKSIADPTISNFSSVEDKGGFGAK